MSIEMQNPQTLVEIIDAAANHLAQLRIAWAVGDFARMQESLHSAELLLFKATEKAQSELTM